MYQGILKKILQRADSYGEPIFSFDEVKLWSDGALDRMVELGLIKPTALASTVICDGCEDRCQEEARYRGTKAGKSQQAYIVCPNRDDMGPVPVNLERLKQWEVNLPVIAHGLAEMVGFTYDIDEIIPGRLWYLGAPYIEDKRIDLFLARGVKWPDGNDNFTNVGRIQECSEPLILVPCEIPSPHPFVNAGRILTLARMLYIDKDGMQMRKDELGFIAKKVRTQRTKIIEPITVRKGTQWKDVFLNFPSDEAVQITGPGINTGRSFAKLGFQDMHDKSPDKGRADSIWALLLVFAKLGNAMTAQEARSHVHRDFGTVKKRVSRLRTMLCAIFPGIPDKKPIGNYRKYVGWKVKINLVYGGEEPL